MYYLIVVKMFFLTIAILFSLVNVTKIIYKEPIRAFNFIIQSLAISMFLGFQFNLFQLM